MEMDGSPSHIRPSYYLVFGSKAAHINGIRDVGIVTVGLDHWMSAINNFKAVAVCKFWTDIVLLKGDLSQTLQAIGNGQLVDCISQHTIVILSNVSEE